MQINGKANEKKNKGFQKFISRRIKIMKIS